MNISRSELKTAAALLAAGLLASCGGGSGGGAAAPAPAPEPTEPVVMSTSMYMCGAGGDCTATGGAAGTYVVRTTTDGVVTRMVTYHGTVTETAGADADADPTYSIADVMRIVTVMGDTTTTLAFGEGATIDADDMTGAGTMTVAVMGGETRVQTGTITRTAGTASAPGGALAISMVTRMVLTRADMTSMRTDYYTRPVRGSGDNEVAAMLTDLPMTVFEFDADGNQMRKTEYVRETHIADQGTADDADDDTVHDRVTQMTVITTAGADRTRVVTRYSYSEDSMGAGTQTVTTVTSYNADGVRTQVLMVSSGNLLVKYDADGDVSSVTREVDAGGGMTVTHTYDAAAYMVDATLTRTSISRTMPDGDDEGTDPDVVAQSKVLIADNIGGTNTNRASVTTDIAGEYEAGTAGSSSVRHWGHSYNANRLAGLRSGPKAVLEQEGLRTMGIRYLKMRTSALNVNETEVDITGVGASDSNATLTLQGRLTENFESCDNDCITLDPERSSVAVGAESANLGTYQATAGNRLNKLFTSIAPEYQDEGDTLAERMGRVFWRSIKPTLAAFRDLANRGTRGAAAPVTAPAGEFAFLGIAPGFTDNDVGFMDISSPPAVDDPSTEANEADRVVQLTRENYYISAEGLNNDVTDYSHAASGGDFSNPPDHEQGGGAVVNFVRYLGWMEHSMFAVTQVSATTANVKAFTLAGLRFDDNPTLWQQDALYGAASMGVPSGTAPTGTGTATWNGEALAMSTASAGEAEVWRADATVEVDFADTEVDVTFDSFVTPHNGAAVTTLGVEGDATDGTGRGFKFEEMVLTDTGTFRHEGMTAGDSPEPTGTVLDGMFYGTGDAAHKEVGGTFEVAGTGTSGAGNNGVAEGAMLFGAFGAVREAPPADSN